MSDFLEIDGQTFRTNKIAVMMPVSEHVLYDAAPIRDVVDYFMRRYTEPWLFPDAPSWPTFEPLPRLAAALRWVEVRRGRARDAWAVLTGRESIANDEEW